MVSRLIPPSFGAYCCARYRDAWRLGLLVILLANVHSGWAAEPPVARTEEWQRLARLWQTMLDHSSNTVYNPELCRALADDIGRADDDLTALAIRRELPEDVTNILQRVLHMRYEYLTDFYYHAQPNVSQRVFDASRYTALWVIEMQLAVLRKPLISRDDEKLSRAAEENVRFQLTYLHHMEEFVTEADRRRMEMKKKEDAGSTVDWGKFDAEVARRENRLLDAYQAHHLPEVRRISEAIPFIVALTRRQPAPAHAEPALF